MKKGIGARNARPTCETLSRSYDDYFERRGFDLWIYAFENREKIPFDRFWSSISTTFNATDRVRFALERHFTKPDGVDSHYVRCLFACIEDLHRNWDKFADEFLREDWFIGAADANAGAALVGTGKPFCARISGESFSWTARGHGHGRLISPNTIAEHKTVILRLLDKFHKQ